MKNEFFTNRIYYFQQASDWLMGLDCGVFTSKKQGS